MKQIRSLSLLAGAVLYLCALAPPALAAPFLPFPPEFKGGNGNFVVGQAIDVKWAVTGSYDSCAPLQYQPAGVHGYKTMPATMVWTSSPANGELKGVFNETGTYEFIVSMSCSLVGGGSATQSGNYYAFVTQPPQPLSMINGPFLPACNVGVPCTVPLAQGGTGTVATTLASGALPPGCSLAGRTLTCSPPTTAGPFEFQVTATDAAHATLTQDYVLVVGPPGAFYTSATSLFFSAVAGGAARTQPLGVAVEDLTTAPFTVASDASWLTASPSSGSTPTSVTVQVDPSKLQANSYQGHLTLTPGAGKQPVTVTVSAAIGQPVPRIGLAPESAEVDLSPAPGVPKSYQLGFQAWNDGSGTLNAQVSAGQTFLNWLSVQPNQVSLSPGQMQTLTVNIDAGALPAGTYTSFIRVTSSMEDRTIPVVLVVPTTQYSPFLRVSSRGYASWDCENSISPGIHYVPQTCVPIFVFNDNRGGPMDFTTSLSGFGGHAVLQPLQGHLDAVPASSLEFSEFQLKVQFDGQLPAGRHEGLLTVTAPGAMNSPASARLVIDLTDFFNSSVKRMDQMYTLDLQVDTPVLVAPPGAQSVTTQVKIDNPTNQPVSFTVTSSSPAVTVATPNVVAAPASTTPVEVRIDPSKLDASGNWSVNIASNGPTGASLSDPWGRLISPLVGTSVQAAPGMNALELSPHAASCTPSRVVMAPAGPPSLFKRLADWPQNIGAVVFDDCGNALSDAGVTASFSNGDAAIALRLTDASNGLYQAAWIPGGVTPNMSITLRAMKGSLTPATAQIFGAILEDTGSPVVSKIANNANPAVLAAPGGTVSISGSNLAAASAGGTSVLIGGVQATLASVSSTQILAKVPSTLAPNARYEVVVLAGDRVSTPKSVLVGAAPSAPAPAAVSPASGSWASATYTFTFTDTAGWQSLTVVDVLINNVLDGRQACYVAFVPSGANGGSVFLVDNQGDAGGPYSGMVLPGAGTVQNSQCSIAGAGSSVSGSGNTLTLTLAITFTASFAGNKVMYLAAQDASANSGWQPLGTCGVPGAAVSGPAAGGVTPAHTTGLGPTTYTFTFTDTNGWQDISVANILIASSINGVGACYVAFIPSGAGAGSVYLVDDAGDAGGPYAGMLLPGNGSVRNSQCTIAGTGSAVTAGGNTLTLTLEITFSSSFTGNQILYLAAGSSRQNSGWQAMGMAGVQ